MCGIAALFSSGAPVTDESLRRAAESLIHRGPDNRSSWLEPDGRAGLAHARLSLLDLSSNGDQPLVSADDRLRLVHNGEFYDFERIKRELQARGHRFHTGSDSEILLPLYTEYGTAALQKLRGEFAFVLWDRKDRQVFAARDRFGIKPLFYAPLDGRLYFASEVKALFAMGVPRRWDGEMVQQYMASGCLPGHRTLYGGVFQIPPGHYLTSSADGGFDRVRLQPYWDFDYPLEAATAGVPQDPREQVEALRAKLLESVRLRLRADVPVACYLSGGLDSCSVLGAAAKEASRPVHAFTLSFVDDPEYDESSVAREMAASCGAVYHEIPIRWNDLVDHFAAAVVCGELPVNNTHGVAKFLLSRTVRQAQFKAVLTGEGSDEIFGGYVHFRKDVLMQDGDDGDREARLSQLVATNAVSRGMMLTADTSPKLRSVATTLGFVPSFLATFGSNERGTLLRDDFRERFEGRDAFRIFLDHIDVPRQLWGRARLNQSLYLWSKTMLPHYLLTVLGDRMEMAHSVEGRLPFLDHELVETVVRMPVALKIRPDLTEKFLLREAARPFITDTVYRRQKHPFLAPPAAAAPGSPLFGLVQDTLRSSAFADQPFFDPGRVAALLDRVPGMSRDEQRAIDPGLMTILSFAVLEKAYGLST